MKRFEVTTVERWRRGEGFEDADGSCEFPIERRRINAR
jgi:hypothetical protein